MMADAALSNCRVSCKFGQVDVVVGTITDFIWGVDGVLELLLSLFPEILETWKYFSKVRTSQKNRNKLDNTESVPEIVFVNV